MPTVDIEGVGEVDFPDTMSRDEIEVAIRRNMASTPAGHAKSAGVGLAKGVAALAGSSGDVRESNAAAVSKLAGYAGLNVPQDKVSSVIRHLPLMGGPTSERVNQAIQGQTGEYYKPKGTEGYTETGASFIPGGVQGIRRGVVRGLQSMGQYAAAPGVASEAADRNLPSWVPEPVRRGVGALAGLAGGYGFGKGSQAVANRLAAGEAGTSLGGSTGAPVGAPAARRLADSLDQGGGAAQARANVAGLGDEAMVMDANRQLQGRAEAIAAQPGRGQGTVLDAVEGRTGRFGEGTAQRVQQTLDAEMGATHNVVELEKRVSALVDSQAKPLYDKVMAAHEVVTVPGNVTSRPAVAGAMKDAETLARQYGEELSVKTPPKTILSGPGFHIADDGATEAGKTSLRYWDYVKKALDKRINDYHKSGGTSELSSKDKADLGGLVDARRSLVEHLDAVTEGAYKTARQTAATKFELREALDYGQKAVSSKLLPEEFAAELAEMSAPARTMAKAGFRRELDRMFESTRNEGASARRVLNTGQVLQKTEALFGPQAAREIEKRILAEDTFQEATNKIAGNSRTALRQQLMKDTATPSTNQALATSLTGVGHAAGRGVMNWIREATTGRMRGQMGDVLASKNVEPVIAALERLNAKRRDNARPIGGRNALINALIQSGAHRTDEY